VRLDGGVGQVQVAGDHLVRLALHDAQQHLPLAFGEAGAQLVPGVLLRPRVAGSPTLRLLGGRYTPPDSTRSSAAGSMSPGADLGTKPKAPRSMHSRTTAGLSLPDSTSTGTSGRRRARHAGNRARCSRASAGPGSSGRTGQPSSSFANARLHVAAFGDLQVRAGWRAGCARRRCGTAGGRRRLGCSWRPGGEGILAVTGSPGHLDDGFLTAVHWEEASRADNRAMSAVFDKPSLRQRVAPMLQGFDGPLAFAVFLLACAGLLTMYSSGFDHGTRFVDHAATCCWPAPSCSWWRRCRRSG
jgi:hypothetical protein